MRNAWLMPHTSSGALAASGWNGQLRSRSQAGASGWVRTRAGQHAPRRSSARVRRRAGRGEPCHVPPAPTSCAALPGDAQCAGRAVSSAPSVQDGVEQELGQQLVAALGDADPHAALGRLVDLGRRPTLRIPPTCSYRARSRPASTSLSRWNAASLREMPDARGRLVAGDRLAARRMKANIRRRARHRARPPLGSPEPTAGPPRSPTGRHRPHLNG